MFLTITVCHLCGSELYVLEAEGVEVGEVISF